VDTRPSLSLTQRRLRREALLAEGPLQRLAREALDLAHVLARPAGAPAVIGCLQAAAEGGFGLPDPVRAVRSPDGLAGPARLCPYEVLDGYGRGLLLRALIGRPTWWSPAQRAVRLLDAGGPAAPLPGFALDEDFEEIAAACARAAVRRLEGGAPTPAMLEVFARLHDRADAHCFALRDAAGLRIAGGWGVETGGVFITQGVFETRPGALAAAFARFEARLAAMGFALHVATAEVARASGLRFPLMRRDAFLELNGRAGACVSRGRWRDDAPLSAAA
jgi:Leu/Phe-tRNA-protein transferase